MLKEFQKDNLRIHKLHAECTLDEASTTYLRLSESVKIAKKSKAVEVEIPFLAKNMDGIDIAGRELITVEEAEHRLKILHELVVDFAKDYLKFSHMLVNGRYKDPGDNELRVLVDSKIGEGRKISSKGL